MKRFDAGLEAAKAFIDAEMGEMLERFGAYCWFVDVEFASGALGHLDRPVPR